MFTGIVEEMGKVGQIKTDSQGMALRIDAKTILQGTQLGDSIAVNGTCLTVTSLTSQSFTTGVSPETRRRTNLGSLKLGEAVNLERACTPATRLGGHMVQGHVDSVGHLLERRFDRESLWLTVGLDPELMRYIVTKGFVCMDGASLTVVDVGTDRFSIMLVPYTQSHIVLPQRKLGDAINIEVDIIGKYVEKMLSGYLTSPENGLSLEKLKAHGFGS